MSSKAETISPLSLPLTSLCTWSSIMTSTWLPLTLTSHHILHIHIEAAKASPSGKSETSSRESKSSTREAKASSSWKSKTSILLESLRVVFSCLVIDSSFFRILEEFISIDNLFKLLLGPWVFFVSVRVVLSRSFLESLSDLLVVGILANTKYLVRIRNLLSLNFNDDQGQDYC